MGQRDSTIFLIRRTPLAIVPILVLAATAITGVLLQENNYSNYVTLIVLCASTGLSLYAYWLVNDINILCIQMDPEPESPARVHHSNEFDLKEGYSEFDTFVDIPEWMDNFILEFDADPPLEIGLWEVPDDYNENGNTIECSENAHDFGFILTVGGDVDKLWTADRKLRIHENVTKTKIATYTLKSVSMRANANYRDQHSNGD